MDLRYFSYLYCNYYKTVEMDIQARKLSLIERVMKIRDSSALQLFEDLLMQAEMADRAERSLNDVKAGKVKPYSEFKAEAKAWIKKRKATK